MLHQYNTQQQTSINITFSQQNEKVDSITFLQVLSVKISNGPKTLGVNALLDSDSDATSITSKLAHQLQLKGEMKQLNISKAISKSIAVRSKLVTFSTSSRHHLQVHNAWVVDILNLPPQKISKREIQSRWPHLIKIPLDINNKDISILIGAEILQLHINHDAVMGRPSEPVAMLTKLGWVLLEGKTKKDKFNASLNDIVTSNVDELVQKLWKVESYCILTRKDVNLLPKNDAHSLQILESTTTKEKDRYPVGLFWRDDKRILPYNRNVVISRMLWLERKFEKQPSLKFKYVETINEYTEKGHACKLPHKARKEEHNEIINYIPHQTVTNINKPGKIRVVFDAQARYENTSLNEKLYKGPDLLSSLARTLLHFRQGK